MNQRILTNVIIALFAIGLISTLIFNPLSIIIPLVILGVIIYFLRRPNRQFRRNGPINVKRPGNPSYPTTSRPSDKIFSLKLKSDAPEVPGKHNRKTKRAHNFRVIEGKKGKSSPADNSDDKHLLH